MNTLGLVLIGSWNDFDDLIARKFEFRDVHGATVHQIGIEHTQDRLVGNDKQIVLLALKFEDNGLEAHRKIVVRLQISVISGQAGLDQVLVTKFGG